MFLTKMKKKPTPIFIYF